MPREVEIESVCRASNHEWDEIWSRCDYATYFHSREWAEIWESYTRGNVSEIKPWPLLVSFSDGKRALIPFSVRKVLKMFLKKYLSSPSGCFGGWISTDGLHREHANLLYDFLLNRFSSVSLRINPYDDMLAGMDWSAGQVDFTQVIPLQRDINEICKEWTKGHRSAVRKAQRLGVAIKIAESEAEWDSYFNAYTDTTRRWGEKAFNIYSRALFRILANRNSANIKLWLATYNDEVIAGAICFYAKKHVAYWHASSFTDYLYLRPAHLIVYETIGDAKVRGYQWFDFNTSGDNQGVIQFKKSFGARKMACPVLASDGWLEGLMNGLYKKNDNDQFVDTNI